MLVDDNGHVQNEIVAVMEFTGVGMVDVVRIWGSRCVVLMHCEVAACLAL